MYCYKVTIGNKSVYEYSPVRLFNLFEHKTLKIRIVLIPVRLRVSSEFSWKNNIIGLLKWFVIILGMVKFTINTRKLNKYKGNHLNCRYAKRAFNNVDTSVELESSNKDEDKYF